MTTVWFGVEVNDATVPLVSTRMTRKPWAKELTANVAWTVTVPGMSAELLAVAVWTSCVPVERGEFKKRERKKNRYHATKPKLLF